MQLLRTLGDGLHSTPGHPEHLGGTIERSHLMMKILNCMGIASIFSWLTACSMGEPANLSDNVVDAVEAADVIFVGENIITMDDKQATAVAIAGEKIIGTGSPESLSKHRTADTRYVELGDRALLPGFIDAHGHVTFHARLVDFQNVSSPPVGTAKTISDIQNLMRSYIADRKIPPGVPVIGYGYDESLLEENRHPTRDDLDAVSTANPIVLLHVSGHLMTANSMTLAVIKYDSDTPNPKGGVIRRRPGSTEPNGVLEETATYPLRAALAGSEAKLDQTFAKGLNDYAANGYTTAQDGVASPGDIAVFRKMAAENSLPIDVTAYVGAMTMKPEQLSQIRAETYKGGFRVAGVKFVLDGSIQGKTGFLGKPYKEPPEGQGADYRAYPTVSQGIYDAQLAGVLDRGVPVLTHANGDAAIDMLLDGLEKALSGKKMPDHRTVIIHAQMAREDQLDRAKTLGAIPSFYSAHPFFWGDWHRQILGEDRAARISPLRSTIDRGMMYTIHNDTPVIPPDVMRLLWITVNRETRSGHVLGGNQKATVMEALAGTTINAAYQLFEEDSKGSITPGKRADLVVLSANPTTVDPGAIKDIKVLETISRGRTVFKSK